MRPSPNRLDKDPKLLATLDQRDAIEAASCGGASRARPGR